MTNFEFSLQVRSRIRAALLHLCFSVLLATVVALCVFGLWFPPPYSEFAGGRELFLLLVSVDVVCGPLLTFVVFNKAKPRNELVRDLGAIAIIQVLALGYGVSVLAQARPVFMAFEVDRFHVVTPADVDPSKLKSALPEFQVFGLVGPTIIGLRVPKSEDADYVESLDLSLAGVAIAFRPSHWRRYDEQREEVVRKAKSVALLKRANADSATAISESVARTGLAESALGYVPIESRRSTGWVALVELSTATVVGYAPGDGF
jgi:hypothetical protein